MTKNRLLLFLAALMALFMLTFAATAQGTLTVTPPAGPPTTVHTVVASGLGANTSYRLDVVFTGSGESVFTIELIADSNGQVSIELQTEESDTLGVYDVNLYDESGELVQTGTITIVEQGPPLDATTLDYNQVVEGTLDESAYESLYTFEGQQGDIVTVTLASADLDTFLMLYGPDGAQLRFNDNGLPPTDSALWTYELPVSGHFTLIATSRDAAETGGSVRPTGDYTLSLMVARSAQEGEIQPGETVVGELSVVAQRTQYEFEGRGGDIVTIDLRSEAFDAYVRLFTAEGTQVAQDDDSGGGLNARINRFRLPADGRYVIIVDGFRGLTGERRIQGRYTVALTVEGTDPVVAQATPSGATPTPLPAVAGASGAIDFGETTIGELTQQAQTGSYTFTGTAGDVVTIALDSEAFDPAVRLIGPNGDVLAEDDDSGPDLNSLVSEFTLPVDGEYTIEVDGFRGPSGDREILGQFSLSLSREGATAAQPSATPDPAQPAATPTTAPQTATQGEIAPGETISGEFTEDEQLGFYQFEGQTGDVVTIDVHSDEVDPLARLIGPDGSVIAEDDDSGGGVQARIAEFTLPADGTYTIEVDAFRGISRREVLGAYEVALTLTPAPVVQAPTSTPEPTEPTEPTATPSSPDATAQPPVSTVEPPAPGETARIAPNDSVTLTFTGAPGEAFTFRFSGSAGDVVGFRVDSDGQIDTKLELVAGDGVMVAEDDDSGLGFDPEMLGITLPAYGGYELIVRPVVEGLTGTATLTYSSLIETALNEGAINVTLNDKYGPQVLRFNGRGGEMVRLIVVSVSQIGGAPEIVVTQGASTLANQMIGRSDRLTFEFEVPADGRVDVKVLRDEGAYGEIEISLERVVEEEPPTEDE